MKELVGKKCRLVIDYDGKLLFFTASIYGCTDTHISFLDKFNDQYTMRIKDIKEVKVIDDG